ncbi:MAG: dimethylarginine dimethylaminohydrolase family protein [Bdellovibrionales bacterium]
MRMIWASGGVNSEWSSLQAVVLHRPGLEFRAIKDPRQVQHLGLVSLSRMKKEYFRIRAVYLRLGIQVIELNPSMLPRGLRQVSPNLVFTRDLFLGTPGGVVIARMASEIRAGEEKFAAATLAAEGVPILATIQGHGLFEGADALWLRPRVLLIGVGARTNPEAFKQIRSLLKGVECVPVEVPQGVQHLLGILQFVDHNLACVRVEKASKALLRVLKAYRVRIIPVSETEEVQIRQGMNFVTVKPRTVVMASGCPDLRSLYRQAGIKIAAEVDVSQYCRAAGGLACATGILSRRLIE